MGDIHVLLNTIDTSQMNVAMKYFSDFKLVQ